MFTLDDPGELARIGTVKQHMWYSQSAVRNDRARLIRSHVRLMTDS